MAKRKKRRSHKIMAEHGWEKFAVGEGAVAWDTEATGFRVHNGARPFAASFCNEDGDTLFFRWDDVSSAERCAIHETLRAFGRAKLGSKPAHNVKFDLDMAEADGWPVFGRVDCTFIAAHTVRSEGPLDAKRLALLYGDVPTDDEEELDEEKVRITGELRHRKVKLEFDYSMLPKELMARYATRDAERGMLLWLLFRDVLREKGNEGLRRVYEMEMRLVPVTRAMEHEGVRVDVNACRRRIRELKVEIDDARTQLFRLAGHEFNPGSPKQLANLFHVELGIPIRGKTKGGKPKMDRYTLIKVDHPKGRKIVKQLFKYRGLSKAESTYFRPYIRFAIPCIIHGVATSAIYADVQQVGPTTGRFAYRKPNLQNIIVDASYSRALYPVPVRNVFRNDPGDWNYYFDFAQIEPRIMAHVIELLVGDSTLADALRTNKDVYTILAAKVAMVTMPEIASTEAALRWIAREKKRGNAMPRSEAKVLFLGVSYQMGPASAAPGLKCSIREAAQAIDAVREAMPAIQDTADKIISQARRDGGTTTLLGRRIPVRGGMEYMSVNHKIQGTAADILKQSMINASEVLYRWRKTFWKPRLFITVHDEIGIKIRRSVRGKHPKKLLREICRAMSAAGEGLSVPLGIDCDFARLRWSDLESVDLS